MFYLGWMDYNHMREVFDPAMSPMPELPDRNEIAAQVLELV
mgnify:CR=1 FL=1